MLVEIFAETLVDQLLDWPLDVAVEFSLGLAFELRLRQLHGDHRDQPFTHIVAGDRNFVFLLLEHSRGRSKIVDRARQRRAEAGEMRPAVHGIDRVGECKHIFPCSCRYIGARFSISTVSFLPSM